MSQSIQDKVSLEVYGIPYNNLTDYYRKQIAPVIEAEMSKAEPVDTTDILDFSEIGMDRKGGMPGNMDYTVSTGVELED